MSGLVKIELVGALRYGYKGEKFERGIHYMVKADRAATLLNLTNSSGFYMFREVGDRPQPVAKPMAPKVRSTPVVDTTKTAAEQYDEAVSASVAASASDDTPVVVQPSASGPVDDISEEEALALVEEDDEAKSDGEPV